MARVDVRKELEKIRLANGGMLTEEAVVTAARAKSHPLHSRFTWDDAEAAKQWRFEEARALIRSVYVTFEQPPDKPVMVRAYASLPSDRESGVRKDQGGEYGSEVSQAEAGCVTFGMAGTAARVVVVQGSA